MTRRGYPDSETREAGGEERDGLSSLRRKPGVQEAWAEWDSVPNQRRSRPSAALWQQTQVANLRYRSKYAYTGYFNGNDKKAQHSFL